LEVILSAFAWLRLREQLDHLADAVRLHLESAARCFRPSSLHRSSTPYIRRIPTWRERGICSAIASRSDPQPGMDHVFRSWPEQDGQKIGVPNYPKVDRRLRRSGNEQKICHL
jgi:hypothetical protein